MNRRNLFKGLAGVAAGLILPPTLEENVEAGKRFWALGGIPEERPSLQDYLKMRPFDMSFMAPMETPMLKLIKPGSVIDYDQVIHDASELYEMHYPLRRPMAWQVRAVEEREMVNAGFLVR